MKPKQGNLLNEELEIVKRKTEAMANEFNRMKELISSAQFMINIGNKEVRRENGQEDPELARIKLEASLEQTLKQLHAKVDGMLDKIKDTTDVVQNFNQDFPS